MREYSLGRSLTGLEIPLLSITNLNTSPEQNAQKATIILTARVHPAESNSSHMLKGVIEQLLGS